MRVAVGQVSVLSDEILAFAAQLGVSGMQMNTPALPGTERWEYDDLRGLVERCAAHGLRLEAIENVPLAFYDKAMLGLPGRDAQIENYRAIIRNMGRAGIPILGYHWMPNSVWRTARSPIGRGGAMTTSFDMAAVASDASNVLVAYADRTGETDADADVSVSADPFDTRGLIPAAGIERTAEEMWAAHEYFLRAVLPVAAEAGVKLALHPDDPPVPVLGGIARIAQSFDDFKRAEQIADSDAWGLDLCLGCWSEMGGERAVLEAIEHFGPRGKILYVHFRDVQGTVPDFAECFLGEGNFRPPAIIRALHRSGFDGFLLDDHVPFMVNDTDYGHRGRAHAIGYLQGLLDALEVEG